MSRHVYIVVAPTYHLAGEERLVTERHCDVHADSFPCVACALLSESVESIKTPNRMR